MFQENVSNTQKDIDKYWQVIIVVNIDSPTKASHKLVEEEWQGRWKKLYISVKNKVQSTWSHLITMKTCFYTRQLRVYIQRQTNVHYIKYYFHMTVHMHLHPVHAFFFFVSHTKCKTLDCYVVDVFRLFFFSTFIKQRIHTYSQTLTFLYVVFVSAILPIVCVDCLQCVFCSILFRLYKLWGLYFVLFEYFMKMKRELTFHSCTRFIRCFWMLLLIIRMAMRFFFHLTFFSIVWTFFLFIEDGHFSLDKQCHCHSKNGISWIRIWLHSIFRWTCCLFFYQ